jgi:phosphate transport system protein
MTARTRSVLDQELQDLDDRILQMGSMVNNAIEDAMNALYSRNTALAQRVVLGDQAVNDVRYGVEMESLKILATQQPMASDLRQIIAAIHIAVELERIGDHASDIADLAGRLADEGEFDTLHKLPKMAKRALKMVQTGVDAYARRDVELARSIIGKDAKIDRQYYELRHEIREEMYENDYIRRATFLMWVGHDLERIGDRATNIAERVIFMTTGEFIA